MNQPIPTNWFVKTEKEVLGPFTPFDLLQQACIGKLLGTSELSANPQGPWLKAETLDSLEMEWQVTPENGDPLPRCHVMALRTWVEDETVQPYWDILHIPSGESYDVVDALCSALLSQNRWLEERLASTPASEPAPDTENLSTQELYIQMDSAKKQSTKWQRLYEEEVQRNESHEEMLLADNEKLRAWQRKAAERIKALERRQTTLDETRGNSGNLESFSGDHDLAMAYQELNLQLTHLLDSLDLKSRQLDESREQVRELKAELRQERHQAEEKVDRVSELHEDTLNHLNEIEQSHIQLTRSYRDLNDRLIQLRNQEPGTPAPQKTTPSAPKAAETPKPTPSKPGKINMT